MKRLLYQNFLDWKNKENRKPLILNGARQVGKTWLVKEFGKNEYKNLVYINCDKNSQVKSLFESGYNIKNILLGLGAISSQTIMPHETLIFIDEIQEIPEALTSLKYFCEEAAEYHIIAAGSLLGVSLNVGTGFPVGKVDILHLYPMSFLEFVLAVKGEQLFSILKEGTFDDISIFHPTFIELLRQYYFCGGMPEAVLAFVEGKSVAEIRTIQESILYSYQKDIAKHPHKNEIPKIHQVWSAIPNQLAKENKKFIYGALKKGARAKDFENAVQWLLDAGVIYKVSNIKKASIPLKFYEDFNAFKLFMLDTGLMGALAETPPSQMLIGNNIFEEFKGAFTELFVFTQLQSLKQSGISSIFYYNAEDSKQELDFIFQKDEKIIPVEVKAEENLRAKSLRQFVLDHPDTKGIRFSMSPYRKQDWMTNIPLYAVHKVLM